MKKQNSEKRFTKFECNYFKPKSVNKRSNSINVYKNNRLENLIRKTETKTNKQNIFELINFKEILLNHYKNYKLYFDKPEEDKGNEGKKKYIKYDDIILGKGAYGKVYLFREIDTEDMNFYAGKIIRKKKLSDIKKTIAQIRIQKEFNNNPKVVGLKDFFEDNKNIYIILELCKNKSLADYLENRGGKLTEIEVKCFMFQLLQGLKYLHNNKIIHRDLKPSNLLLDDKYELKIGDFGKIAEITENKKRRYTVCGTYNYMAPEMFENNGKGYSFEVDIWSVGIIMYQLLTGKLPFNGENKDEIKKNILASQPESLDVSGLSIVAASLIKQILRKDPKKRPVISQIVYHYFFHDTEFPKYITSEFLNNGKGEKGNNKEKDEEKMQKLKIHLHTLIVDDIPKIEYENIKKYVIKEYANVYEHYITYYHELSNYNCCYYELNNQIIGMIFKNEGKNINMIYNTETEFFYLINIDDYDKDNDVISKYTKEEIPDELKKDVKIFLNYFQLLLKKKDKEGNIEENDEDTSIEEQISFSQRNEQNSISNENSIISQDKVLDKTNLVYVREIITDKEVTILFLSDRTIEAIFKDKVKILLSEIKEHIEIIKKNNKIILISVQNAFQNSSQNYITRIKYIKRRIYKYINEKLIIK